MPITYHKAKNVPIDPNNTKRLPWVKPEQLPAPPSEAARRDVFNTYEAKQRKAFADAGHADWAGQENWMSSGEPYKPPLSGAEIPMDMLKSIASGGVGMLEQGIGQLGDVQDLRYSLANTINDYFKGSSGMDLGPGIAKAEEYKTPLPGTDDVARTITDPLLTALGPTAQEWGRYQPQSPWGQALSESIQMMDPVEVLPFGKVGKFIKKAVR